MSDPVLPLLVGIIAALLALGAAGFVVRGSRQAIGFAGAGLGGLGLILTLLSLIMAREPDTLALPLGPPGLSLHVALDPLSAFFLLLAFLAGTAGIAFAAEADAADHPSTLAGVAICMAGIALAELAADGVTLALAVTLAGSAIWATGEAGRPRALQLGITVLAAFSALAAMSLLAGSDASFGTVRAEQRGIVVGAYVLTAIGPAALAGLVPFHHWVIPAHRAAPARAGALLSGAVQPLAVYIMLRLLFELTGPSTPLWFGIPWLAMGAASSLLGGWRAAKEPEIDGCLAAMSIRQAGLVAIGIGLALIGRGADLPTLTTLALGSVLLLTLAQTIGGTLAQMAGGAIMHGAGSRRLERLGGLIHQMPVTTFAMMTGLHGMSALPAGAGFAGLFMLFQALLSVPRSGGLPAALGLAVLALAIAASAALASVASVRLIGIACLGRPRTPRSAAAVDLAKQARPPILALGTLMLLVGVFPGPLLRLLADPAIRQMTGTGLGQRAGIFGLAVSSQATGYQVVPLVFLVCLLIAALYWGLRRRGGPPPRIAPAWNGGFAPNPPWLPFGDPLTQSAGTLFVPDAPKPPGLPARVTIRITASVGLFLLLAVLAGLLAVLACIGAA